MPTADGLKLADFMDLFDTASFDGKVFLLANNLPLDVKNFVDTINTRQKRQL